MYNTTQSVESKVQIAYCRVFESLSLPVEGGDEVGEGEGHGVAGEDVVTAVDVPGRVMVKLRERAEVLKI